MGAGAQRRLPSALVGTSLRRSMLKKTRKWLVRHALTRGLRCRRSGRLDIFQYAPAFGCDLFALL